MLDHYPGDLAEVMEAALDQAPEATLPRLLATAEQEPRSGWPATDRLQPLRAWLRELPPDDGVVEAMRRREIAVGMATAYLSAGGNAEVGVQALRSALSPRVGATSRDPGLPPLDYLGVSGGQFRDMTIHDFDMARWMLGEEPTEVFAWGGALVDRAVAEAGDIDSCMVLLRTASGRMAHINNSRRATYGYDQRVEVHGSLGRLIAGNRTPTTVEQSDAHAVSSDKPSDSLAALM